MSVNRGPGEVMLDEWWAVWGVFIWRPSGAQGRFFTTASFCLHVWVAVSVQAPSELKGALQGTWLFPHPGTMFPVPSWMQVLAVFTSVKMSWDFQLCAEPWWRVSISEVCLQDIYTSACLLFVGFMHLFLWSEAQHTDEFIPECIFNYEWLKENLQYSFQESLFHLNRPWVRVKNMFLLVVVYLSQDDLYYVYLLTFL